MSEPTYATPANMRKWEEDHPGRRVDTGQGIAYIEGARCLAYSPRTDEEYSASPGDYWQLADDEPLRDSDGEAMFLVRKQTRYLDAFTGEEV